MTNRIFRERLRNWAAARGYGLAVAGIDVLEAVKKKLEQRKSAGLIDAGFFDESLAGFRYFEDSAIAGPEGAGLSNRPGPSSSGSACPKTSKPWAGTSAVS